MAYSLGGSVTYRITIKSLFKNALPIVSKSGHVVVGGGSMGSPVVQSSCQDHPSH